MLKYENKGYVIEINLPTNKKYNAVCRYMYDTTQEKYLLSMWIRRNDIDDLFKIDMQKIDTQYISGTKETIKQNICKIVEQACALGFFDRYIERFEYTCKCFNIGNDICENDEK